MVIRATSPALILLVKLEMRPLVGRPVLIDPVGVPEWVPLFVPVQPKARVAEAEAIRIAGVTVVVWDMGS